MTAGGMKNAVEAIGYRRLSTILAVAIAWLGLWTHEFYRMPSALGLTLDGSLPLLLTLQGGSSPMDAQATHRIPPHASA